MHAVSELQNRERLGTMIVCIGEIGVVPTVSFHRVVVELSVLDGRIGLIIFSVHTDQDVANRRGNRSLQVIPVLHAATIVAIVSISVAMWRPKVTTVHAMLVLPMVTRYVVRIQGRLEVLRKVGMGGCHQRGLDQCHVLVQQAMIIIVHAHRSHCNDVKVG